MKDRITRRDLIKAGGLAGVAFAVSPGAGPTLTSRSDGPEAFLEWAYAERSRAATSGTLASIDRIYEPSSALAAFERQRAQFLADPNCPLWAGRVVRYRSSVSLVDLDVQGGLASAKLIENFETIWRPASGPTQIAGATRLAFPVNGRGEASSAAGIKHEVVLARHADGWRIAMDQHDEFYIQGASPDLRPGSWANERPAGRGLNSSPVPEEAPRSSGRGPGLARPDLSHLTYWAPSAIDWAETYALSYHSSYCNYNSCGGDCANFVSQCLRNGGHVNAGAWYTFNGGCGTCGTSKPSAGTDTWANNWMLRNYVINQGRGSNVAGEPDLGSGDLINYDWTNGGASFDHITITTYFIGGDAHICSHNPDLKDYIWHMNQSATHRFTHLWSSYHQ